MRLGFSLLLGVLVAGGCAHRLHRAIVPPGAVKTVDRSAPYLKAHMQDGTVYVLSDWTVDEALRRVRGTGTQYGLARQVLSRGTFDLALDSVALFETNVARPSPSVAVLGVITGVTAAITVFCITVPKACFGSCPTFYVSDGKRDLLQAEGFSASIAPSLEARDVDALFRARPRDREVRIRMVNEALETHIVRSVNVLAVPRPSGGRVFRDTDDAFWSAPEPTAPVTCTAPEGDCRAAVIAFDERERTSEADSVDLATRETVDLTFAPMEGRLALVVASRQSLLPTYLLYQTFAYLGTSVGYWLAAFERADKDTRDRAGRLVATLGGIDVLIPDGRGGWDSVATIMETGPLASDLRLVPLPGSPDSVRVRLRMARGAWRLDLVGLTRVGRRAEPVRLLPHTVVGPTGQQDSARAKLHDPTQVLVTFPGDEYTMTYRLPDDGVEYELFLEGQGYYLEWMRREWIAEENLASAAAMFFDPAGSLRRLAPAFKQVEPHLEASFWGSKYVRR